MSEVADGRSGTPASESKLSETGSIASAGRTPTVGQPPNPLAAQIPAGDARNNDYRREGYPDGKITQNGAKAAGHVIPAPGHHPGGLVVTKGWVLRPGRPRRGLQIQSATRKMGMPQASARRPATPIRRRRGLRPKTSPRNRGKCPVGLSKMQR